MPRRENVLAVSSEAILIDHGYDVCFVVHEDSLERRQVKLGKTTRELVEVTQGLEAGEQVVLNPQPTTRISSPSRHGSETRLRPAGGPRRHSLARSPHRTDRSERDA